jgi:flavin-dependent dehydrogenase
MSRRARRSFDAVIVGGGPAGSTAAILLARAGWSVALVERQRFPRRKVCGECMAASNMPLLRSLGVGDVLAQAAGSELREVRLLHGQQAVRAPLPAGVDPSHPWGLALGREVLDTALLQQARLAGTTVFQPWSLHSMQGAAGAWRCELRDTESAALLHLGAALVIDAHGSWEDLPADRPRRRLARGVADLLSFKAQFTGAALPAGAISVLALDGGYGGMVRGSDGVVTVACCVRRDRLTALREARPGVSAGEVVEDFLRSQCQGTGEALQGATRAGPWLASGPLDPGVRLRAQDAFFRVGNAAGEVHPIVGEGLSMAVQSSALLCAHLLSHAAPPGAPSALEQARIQRSYARAWGRAFKPRLRLAAVMAHAAMRPRPARLLLRFAHSWPQLLTLGARWAGKTQPAAGTTPPATAQTRSHNPIST